MDKANCSAGHRPINPHNLIHIVPQDIYIPKRDKDKIKKLLELADELLEKLELILNDDTRTICQKFQTCILKMKRKIKKSSLSTESLGKVENSLNALSVRIDKDSKTALNNPELIEIDLTVDEDDQANIKSSSSSVILDSNDIQPDSTVDDGDDLAVIEDFSHKNVISHKSKTATCDVEDEITSTVRINGISSPILDSITKTHSSFGMSNTSTKRSTDIIDMDELARNLNIPIKQKQMSNENNSDVSKNKKMVSNIMQMAKENTRKPEDKETEVDRGNIKNSCPQANEEHIFKAIDRLKKTGEIGEEMTALFSSNVENSSSNVENRDKMDQLLWETNAKQKMNEYPHLLPKSVDKLSSKDYPCQVSEKKVPEQPNLLKGKLSDALEKLIKSSINDEQTQPGTSTSGIVGKPVEKPIPVNVPVPNCTEANVNKETQSSIRGKLKQEIAYIHKAGVESKIHGSLKKLKNDPKKTESSSNDVIINPFVQKCVENEFPTSPNEHELTHDPHSKEMVSPKECNRTPSAPNSPLLKDTRTKHRITPPAVSNQLDPRPAKTPPERKKPVLESDVKQKSRSPDGVPVSCTPKLQKPPIIPKSGITSKDKVKDERPYLKKPPGSFLQNHRQRDQPHSTPFLNAPKHYKFAKHKLPSMYQKPGRRKSEGNDTNKPLTTIEDVKQQLKDKTEFHSPLANMYPLKHVSRTGKGYGSNLGPKFKIPKVNKPVFLNEKESDDVPKIKSHTAEQNIIVKPIVEIQDEIIKRNLKELKEKMSKKVRKKQRKAELLKSKIGKTISSNEEQSEIVTLKKKRELISELDSDDTVPEPMVENFGHMETKNESENQSHDEFVTQKVQEPAEYNENIFNVSQKKKENISVELEGINSKTVPDITRNRLKKTDNASEATANIVKSASTSLDLTKNRSKIRGIHREAVSDTIKSASKVPENANDQTLLDVINLEDDDVTEVVTIEYDLSGSDSSDIAEIIESDPSEISKSARTKTPEISESRSMRSGISFNEIRRSPRSLPKNKGSILEESPNRSKNIKSESVDISDNTCANEKSESTKTDSKNSKSGTVEKGTEVSDPRMHSCDTVPKEYIKHDKSCEQKNERAGILDFEEIPGYSPMVCADDQKSENKVLCKFSTNSNNDNSKIQCKTPTKSDIVYVSPDKTDKEHIVKNETVRPIEKGNDNAIREEEILEHLKSVPGLKSVVEKLGMRGDKLYFHLFNVLNSEQFKLVQDVFKRFSSADTNEQNVDEKNDSLPELNEVNLHSDQSEPKKISETSENDIKKSGQQTEVETIGADELREMNNSSKSEEQNLEVKECDLNVNENSEVEKKMVTVKRSKKRVSELDRLHADIKKMKHTKNNIFTAIGTRSCRRQAPMYTERYLKVGGRVDKLKPSTDDGRHHFSNDSSTDSEEEILMRSKICRAKGRCLASDSDSSSKNSEGRIQGKKVSKIVSTVSSTEEVTEQKTKFHRKRGRPKTKRLVTQKACPKSVKVQLYGKEAVTEYESNYPELKVVLTKLSNDKIDQISRRPSSHSDTETHANLSSDKLDSSVSETNDDSVSYMIVTKPRLDEKESMENSTANQKSENTDILELEPTSITQVTEKIKLKKVNPDEEKIRMNLENYQRNLKNEKRKKTKKAKKCSKKNKIKMLAGGDNISKVDVNPPDTPLVHSQDEAAMETSTTEAEINERISKLPKHNALKDNVPSLNLMSIIIESRDSKLLYKCVTSQCKYDTNDAPMFANHLSFLHKDVDWNGRCSLCNSVCEGSDLIDTLSHLMQRHLITIAPTNEKSSSEGFDAPRPAQIKTEPGESQNHETPLPVLEERGEKTTTEVPSEIPELISSVELPELMSSGDPPELISSVQPPELLSSVDLPGSMSSVESPELMTSVESPESMSSGPRLRVRRLSGDKLSGKAEDDSSDLPSTSSNLQNTSSNLQNTSSDLQTNNSSDRTAEEQCNNEDNRSFAFVISDVKTIEASGSQKAEQTSERSRVLENITDKTLQNGNKLPSNASVTEDAQINAEKEVQNVNETEQNVLTADTETNDFRISTRTNLSQKMTVLANFKPWEMMHLYKCSDTIQCSYSTDVADEFRDHLLKTHRQNRRYRQRKLVAECLKCLYCSTVHATPELLIRHISDVHLYCQYQCPHCVFRACRPVYVMWHLSSCHPNEKQQVYVSDVSKDNSADVISFSVKHQSLSASIPILKCNHGCTYETLSVSEFENHMKQCHGLVQPLTCHICGHFDFKLESLLKHFNLHCISEYQCVYCTRGSSNVDGMKTHLLQMHPFLYPKAVKRADKPQPNCDDIWTKYLINLIFDESLDTLRKNLHVVGQNNDSVITLYRDDDSPESAPVSATCRYIPNKDREYVLSFDGGTSAPQSPASEHGLLTNEANNAVSTTLPISGVTGVQNDAVVSSASPTGLSLPSNEGLESEPTVCVSEINDTGASESEINDTRQIGGGKITSTKKLNKKFGNNQTIIGLTGTALYKCGMMGCNVAAEDLFSFREHTFTCDNARNTKGVITCPHCNRSFLKNHSFFNHLCSHGIPRFYCTFCDFKYTSSKKVMDHMKTHKILKTTVMPADPLKNNKEKDIFLVIPDVEKKGRWPQKFTKSPLKNHSPAHAPSVTPQKTQITKVYCVSDVERLGLMQLFNEPIGCGICNEYSTKVRTNILYHLKSHELGLATNKDIINPVPRMEKKELMFNKMTNHAAYTVKNDDKRNSVQTKCEKLEEGGEKKTSIIPDYVPRTYRFTCGAPGCNYVTQDGNGLKCHFETLHNELSRFSCPHCGCEISIIKINSHFRYHNSKLYKCSYCEYVHFQRHGIERHQSEKHPTDKLSVQVLREMSQEEVDKLDAEARINFSVSFNNKDKQSQASCWKCSLCKSGTTVTEDLMKMHCLSSHRINDKYKCSLCMFSGDDKQAIKSHLKTVHGSVTQHVLTIYKEINESEDLPSPICSNPSPTVQSGVSGRNVHVPSSTTSKSPSPLRFDFIKELPKENLPGSEINKTMEEITTFDLDSRNRALVRPYPDGTFRCPHCTNFRTTSLEKMRDHIYTEENYDRFVCTKCGVAGVSKGELERHLITQRSTHGDFSESYIQRFTADEDYERKVQQILNYQSREIQLMSKGVRMQNQASSTAIADMGVIEIQDSSDEESTSVNTRRRRSSDSNCGSSNAANSKNAKNNVPVLRRRLPSSTPNSSPKKTASDAVSYYPCEVQGCNMSFNSARGLTCHKMKRHSNVSPVKIMKMKKRDKPVRQDYVELCQYCGVKCATYPVFYEHIEVCEKRPGVGELPSEKYDLRANNSGGLKRHAATHRESTINNECIVCTSGDLTSAELVRHQRAMHEKFGCMFCTKILTGERRLEEHISISYSLDSSRNQPNEECVPAKNKIVELLCPFCSFVSHGSTFANYKEVTGHVQVEHPSRVSTKNDNVEVRIDGGTRRPLTGREIMYLQLRSNYPQNAAPQPVKRRNVAIKSTSRLPMYQTAHQAFNKLVLMHDPSDTNTPVPVPTTPHHRPPSTSRPRNQNDNGVNVDETSASDPGMDLSNYLHFRK